MTSYRFTLICDAADFLAEDVADALFEAGCDDALAGVVDGVPFIVFDREAKSPLRAVRSAVADVESVEGVQVVRIAGAGLVSMADIAERAGRTRESVRLLVAGERGPGGFPPPVTDPRGRYRLWRWAEVRRWFAESLGEEIAGEDAHVLEALNAGLELRHHARYVSEELRAEVRDVAGLWDDA